MIRKIPLIGRIMIGFVLGTATGLVLSECCTPETVKKVVPFVSPFGNVLVAMLKMVVYPIILFSLILGAASLPLRKSGRVGASVLLWYFATSVFATVFGVALAWILVRYTFPGRRLVDAIVDLLGVKSQAFLQIRLRQTRQTATQFGEKFQFSHSLHPPLPQSDRWTASPPTRS